MNFGLIYINEFNGTSRHILKHELFVFHVFIVSILMWLYFLVEIKQILNKVRKLMHIFFFFQKLINNRNSDFN